MLVHHTFLYISPPFLHDSMADVNKRGRNDYELLFSKLGLSLGVQLQMASPAFDEELKRVRIEPIFGCPWAQGTHDHSSLLEAKI